MFENLILIGTGIVLGVMLTAIVILIVARRRIAKIREQGFRIGDQLDTYSAPSPVRVVGDLEVEGEIKIGGTE